MLSNGILYSEFRLEAAGREAFFVDRRLKAELRIRKGRVIFDLP